ncbi:ABC transporter substrate-binding protein [Acidisphaera sp. L21]|uniref:ABC transporter substrate-binding protein n=1 Tax=Acidisphaera sp. L21 TaxID=1641851 RepID=UPI00131A6523|nr:ABC transporter substrate-binding protein [Acidisphaera sp. L21]
MTPLASRRRRTATIWHQAILLVLLLATGAQAQGIVRLVASAGAGSIDPQINYTGQYWQLFTVVFDGLVGFRRVPGAAGLDLVPDLADAVPHPTDDGLLYTFHIRPGLRFSDGAPVRASDAAASFRRIFRIVGPTAGSFYGGIVGAADCLRVPASCILPGVMADDATGVLTIRLTRRDPDFLLKLALPHASILPANSPPHDSGTQMLIGTGPYRFARYDPATGLRLERNPLFHAWNPDAQPPGIPDAIEYHFGLEDEAEVTQVENGQADWMFETPPLDRLGELGQDYASQVHTNPAMAIWFLPMNTHEPPFDDIRVRRAVNMALDRGAAVKLFGGPRLAEPSCQILPPGIPGYAPYCPFTHDLAAAQLLVRESGKAGSTVTLVIDTSAVQRAIGTYLLDVLRQLGFDARLRVLSGNLQFSYIQNTANHVQISLTPWYSDYPGATDFLPLLFGCASYHPGSDGSVNFSGICDPALDARMQAVADGGDAAGWAAIDREVTDRAAFAVLFNPRYVDFVSRRVEGFAYHEQYHWLLSSARVH